MRSSRNVRCSSVSEPVEGEAKGRGYEYAKPTVSAADFRQCLPPHRDRYALNDSLAVVVISGGAGAINTAQRRDLRAALRGREPQSVRISATASPSVSILNSYNASGANGSAVVGPGGFSPTDGCRFMIRIVLQTCPGLGKTYRSVRSSRPRVFATGNRAMRLQPERALQTVHIIRRALRMRCGREDCALVVLHDLEP